MLHLENRFLMPKDSFIFKILFKENHPIHLHGQSFAVLGVDKIIQALNHLMHLILIFFVVRGPMTAKKS